MRLPIAPEGKREIALAVVVAVVWALLATWWGAATWAWIGLLVPAAVVAFFRDPPRRSPAEAGLLVGPADGRVTHVERIDREPTIGGPAVRISIFLSIFDVHVNRSPCAGRVIDVRLRPGAFHDARSEASAPENHANTVTIAPADPVTGPVIVRQIAGKIARRIVCNVRPGDELQAGQKFGMIKFGSRTDLILPAQPGLEVLVQPGRKVKAGKTVVARIAPEQDLPEGGESTAALAAGEALGP